MYIIKSDYKSRILTELLNTILTRIVEDETGRDEEVILQDVSKTAEDIIAGYSAKLYDIEPEWAKIGGARNYQILNWAVNIALYLLYQRIEDYDVPQKVIKNYDDTIDSLERLSMGKFNINLPPAPINQDDLENNSGFGLRRIGSFKARTHRI